MKNLELVPKGHSFLVDEENPFLISKADLQDISRIGVLVYTLLRTVLQGIKGSPLISDLLSFGLSREYRSLGVMHPERLPTLIRVDLMVDVYGRWKIAEIDPSNKHGMGFALAARYESGAGDRQKLLSLLAPYVTDDLTIVLARKESFFRFEQRYLAKLLSEKTGKKVVILPEDKITNKLERGLILDFPFCSESTSNQVLARRFADHPESFVNPPRHFLGGKALMTVPYEHGEWLESVGMQKSDTDELKKFLPPTYIGPFVGKEVFSSGAKGVFFHGVEKRAVFQQYVTQRPFTLGGREKFIRMACFFVGSSLGELVVSAHTELPVHGGDTAVNHHVNLEKEE